jgi:ribulose-phosphate 3-epimerase
MKAGVAINPHTPVRLLEDILPEADLFLIMSVNPGFGGQSFIEHSYEKIRQLRSMLDEHGLTTDIEVDGGVNMENAEPIINAGASVLVAGNSVFRSKDPLAAIKTLKAI